MDLGLSTTSFADERLKRILRGAKRKIDVKPQLLRKDLTKEVLQKIIPLLHNTHDDLNLYAAFCTAFAAFLWLGEFTWDLWSLDSHFTCFSRSSVTFTAEGNAHLYLPVSKTDPFRQGVTI